MLITKLNELALCAYLVGLNDSGSAFCQKVFYKAGASPLSSAESCSFMAVSRTMISPF
jgi:hypothetical protein